MKLNLKLMENIEGERIDTPRLVETMETQTDDIEMGGISNGHG